jgi:hypothetical protein
VNDLAAKSAGSDDEDPVHLRNVGHEPPSTASTSAVTKAPDAPIR